MDAAAPRVETPGLANANTHTNLGTAQLQAKNPSAPRMNEPATRNTGPASNTRTASRRKAVEHCAQILAKELIAQTEGLKTKIELKGVKELINSVIDLETETILSI